MHTYLCDFEWSLSRTASFRAFMFQLEMHDETFHFEISKNVVIFLTFKDPLVDTFHETFNCYDYAT